ncbi:flagellar biosynthesis anti-sigma factor FlgM [Aquibacillus sp. 3ASR75-11]|uniref:Negative regulator of flagellin synthesis n=1 Tax=Terrihalobacillus insolitus TaxID=2950438 RepID=A0A9X4AM24_9BACI|nr:flagellar biosynthesis anti-sigma factor FlgM [Terrihalobacillus insolitus]MDC3412223.1 flagellar biosynthesis anti-sigma factor FlgM [Terrihalobacillus insolitus]MDC3423083.1 flagellar biosynthesis anti-sigma factor FlgM [Terrihalobacillus insolitus]
MKIEGTNYANINAYQKQTQKQINTKKETSKQDQLQISDQAKQMQETMKPDAARRKYVEQIKEAVSAGEYKVDPKTTAKKMIEFWTNQS